MKFDIMWIWWSGTVILCAWKILEGLLRPIRMLEWPFLAAIMWAYFYGYMACNAMLTLPEYLGNGITNLGQLMPLLCLIGLLWGWSVGKRRSRVRFQQSRHSLFQLWLAGIFFLLLGTVGGFAVMRQMATGSLDLRESSGYWYLIFYVGYPGLAIALWASLKMSRDLRTYCLIITAMGLAAFLFPHLFNARRGPLFPAILILLIVPSITLRRPPKRLLYIGGLAVTGLVMLLFLQVRQFTYHGGSWSDAVQNLSVESAISDRAQTADDNEYVASCQVIGTIFQNGKYQYGTGHLGLLLHWIPRAIWKDKPMLGEGSYSFVEMYNDIESATGYQLLLGSGASSAGVADTFVQYGVFCPVFWFVLSWMFAIVYTKALYGGSARWLFCYVGFICASHWLVSQSLPAAFVPGMYFQFVPVVVFALLDSSNRKTVGRKRQAQAPPPAIPVAENTGNMPTPVLAPSPDRLHISRHRPSFK